MGGLFLCICRQGYQKGCIFEFSPKKGDFCQNGKIPHRAARFFWHKKVQFGLLTPIFGIFPLGNRLFTKKKDPLSRRPCSKTGFFGLKRGVFWPFWGGSGGSEGSKRGFFPLGRSKMAYFRGGRGGSKRANSQILGQKGGFLGGFGGQKGGFLAFFGFFRPFLLGYTLKRGSKRGGRGGFLG